MNIEEQFNRIAEEYDINRRKFIPCFDDFYLSTTKFISSSIEKPRRIVDLGAGTGLLTYFWYQQFPNSEYILMDIADDMLNVAKRRFSGIDTISYQVGDYTACLPSDFDAVISALSIHHLEDADKAKLISRIYSGLPTGGVFVNYDQFCASQPEMEGWLNSYWESFASGSGLSQRDLELWHQRRKLDKECTVEQETDMLLGCGFKVVQCVYLYHKFAVIVAVK
jgi:ubiquinone/menaquinone biosynthesis C-methylase UbiE